MSDTSQIPSILNDASSMLYDAFSIFSGFFTFFGFIALYILGLLVGALIPLILIDGIGLDPSRERSCGLAITNGVFFTISIAAGLDKYYLDKGCWHAFGVGWILLGGLVVFELVVIGVVGLCSCCANANARRRKRKQDGVRLGTFADAGTLKDTATQKNKGGLERKLSV